MFKINEIKAQSDKQKQYAINLIKTGISEIENKFQGVSEKAINAMQAAIDDFVSTNDAGKIIDILKEELFREVLNPLFKKHYQS